MIKVNSKITGTVSRDAEVRTSSQGSPFISFPLKVEIQDRAEGAPSKVLTFFIQDANGGNDSLNIYKTGKRLEIVGETTLHKDKEDGEISFFTKATSIKTENVAALDSIIGDIQFIGTIGTTNAIEEKTDKNGSKYLLLQAYSSEKAGENFTHIWVRFMRFTPKEEGEELRPSCIKEKGKVRVTGSFQLQSYKGKLSISARADKIQEYVPSASAIQSTNNAAVQSDENEDEKPF